MKLAVVNIKQIVFLAKKKKSNGIYGMDVWQLNGSTGKKTEHFYFNNVSI